jgi:hypothetical protein
MTDLDRAIDKLRLSRGSRQACCNLEADIDDLIAAIDVARGQAVATVTSSNTAMTFSVVTPGFPDGTPLYAAPPASHRDETPTDVGGESVPRWVVEYADALATYFSERGGGSWAIGGVQSREKAPPAVAAPAANVTPLRQPRLDLARLADAISAAVYDNAKGLSVTEAIGALEIAKLELLKDQEQ